MWFLVFESAAGIRTNNTHNVFLIIKKNSILIYYLLVKDKELVAPRITKSV